MSDRAWPHGDAFAPGHVTGIFAPAAAARDPRGRGSKGAGIVLELGVRARASFRPGPGRSVRVTSDLAIPLPISQEVARRLAPERAGALSVRLVHELPIGQGFGMSAAGATATALAVAALSDRSRGEAVEVAHLADLFGSGGLGGVAAIEGGGGFELRRRPGLPPRGNTVHRRFTGTLFVGVVGGPIPTPRLLRERGFLDRVAVASKGLDGLLRRPSAAAFFGLSERFTDRLGLAPPPLTRVLSGLRARGAWAAQAMFGRSFFARPRNSASRARIAAWLETAGVRAVELSAAERGATVLMGDRSRGGP
ncbi:MAG: hypothetical protein ACRECT_06700 [Thermoplasmata archaeon]